MRVVFKIIVEGLYAEDLRLNTYTLYNKFHQKQCQFIILNVANRCYRQYLQLVL